MKENKVNIFIGLSIVDGKACVYVMRWFEPVESCSAWLYVQVMRCGQQRAIYTAADLLYCSSRQHTTRPGNSSNTGLSVVFVWLLLQYFFFPSSSSSILFFSFHLLIFDLVYGLKACCCRRRFAVIFPLFLLASHSQASNQNSLLLLFLFLGLLLSHQQHNTHRHTPAHQQQQLKMFVTKAIDDAWLLLWFYNEHFCLLCHVFSHQHGIITQKKKKTTASSCRFA